MEGNRIEDVPAAGYYFPNFISEDEEACILQQIEKTPESKWTVLSHRRLLSLPTPLTGTARDTLLAAPLPAYLDGPMLARFTALGLFSQSPHKAPNHVLINRYQPGEGIMPHEDGRAYFPITATVSLGGHTVLEIYQKNLQGEREVSPKWRILQEPRSLLVTTGDMYKNTLHGISNIEADSSLDSDSIVNWGLLGDTSNYDSGSCSRETRVSLTYRDVLKVAKLGGAMKFIGKR